MLRLTASMPASLGNVVLAAAARRYLPHGLRAVDLGPLAAKAAIVQRPARVGGQP
jgi:hypothetical protein